MKVRREAVGRGDQIDDLARAVHRLERADAEAAITARLNGRARDRRRARAAARSATTRGSRSRPYEPRWTPVSAISLKPAAVTRSTSRSDLVERHASRRPSRRRDDAVGTRLGAAGLHAQRERRAAGDARLDRRAARAVTIAEPRRPPRTRSALRSRRSRRSPDVAGAESAAACRR